MKAYYTILFSVFFSVSSITAQIEDFDIGEFALPEVSLRSLNFTGTLNGQNRRSSSSINTGIQSSLSFSALLNYSNYESSPSHQKQVWGNLQSSFNYTNSSTDINGLPVQDALTNNSTVFINNERRNYFTENKFYGVNYDIWIRNNFNSGENNGNIRFFENALQTSVGIPFTFGFGRIELVTDAWRAVRILNDLDRFNTLSHMPTHDEIYDLAEALSRIRNDRIFDNRLGRIKRIQQLDKHIMDAGLVREHNSTYFTSLYDMYQYGVQAARFSGERITFALIPGVELQSYSENTQTTSYQYLLSGSAEYDFNHPINQSWQLDINIKAAGGIQRSNSGLNTWVANPSLSIKGGYYPTSRTFFTSELKAGGQYRTLGDLGDQFSIFAGIQGNIYYFFSPRTAIRANLGYTYTQSGNENPPLFPYNDQEGFRFTYNVSLTHAFY